VYAPLFSLAELHHLTARLAAEPLQRSRAGARHVLGCEAVAHLARDPRLVNIASRWLGAAAIPIKATLFEKSAEANWLVSWHQDTALPMVERREAAGWGPWSEKFGVTYAHAPGRVLERVIALRVHFNDSTTDNGPLRVLPGTHTQGVLDDAQIHELSLRVVSVRCTVPAGGVIAVRPLLVHASSKLCGQAPRRVLHFEYAASLVPEPGLELRAAQDRRRGASPFARKRGMSPFPTCARTSR
jgi:ectoine hydroxylase-related dioxygenase (phytanoyl-CoA dioxygenase family)